jgi:hypothetical protein
MSTEPGKCVPRRAVRVPRRAAQRGVAAVEFALGAVVFFTLIFGIIEMARALYLISTLVEVNRSAARGAAVADMGNATTSADVLGRAMFEAIPGGLPLGGGLNKSNLAVDYLNNSLTPIGVTNNCPEQNIINCAANPDGNSCIRFVRVRLCADASKAICERVRYVPLIGLGFPPGTLDLPHFDTVTPAGTLGYRPGVAGACSWNGTAYQRG